MAGQCWADVVDGPTLTHHWFYVSLLLGVEPSTTIYLSSVGLVLGQRRRRWANIGPTIGQYRDF